MTSSVAELTTSSAPRPGGLDPLAADVELVADLDLCSVAVAMLLLAVWGQEGVAVLAVTGAAAATAWAFRWASAMIVIIGFVPEDVSTSR